MIDKDCGNRLMTDASIRLWFNITAGFAKYLLSNCCFFA